MPSSAGDQTDMSAGPPGPPGPPEFEFSPQQNRLFAELASAMRFVGICFIIVAVLTLLSAFTGRWDGVVAGFIYLAIGILTNNSGKFFRNIVDTRGRDIANLMEAINSLRALYQAMRLLIILALILAAIVLALALAAWLAHGH